ncbi:MAG: hypothetical protein GY822_03205 [Deltaproteobacteria bacterium]|nr:hypothetical protein [Deltaproteobacteria bacterium]
MSLRTAPCTRCSILVAFGQRKCFRCNEPFNYGPNPPPEPPQNVLEEVYKRGMQELQAKAPPAAGAPPIRAAAAPARAAVQPPPAQARPQSQVQPLPAQAPGDAWDKRIGAQPVQGAVESFVESGRFDDANAHSAVEIEEVPGLIDSRLYGAFTPERVFSPPMEGLVTPNEAPAAIPDGPTAAEMGVMTTEYAAVGAVASEVPEGFIDSTLFAQYTPKNIVTESMPGIERVNEKLLSPSAAADDTKRCSSCGTALRKPICEACGARHPDEEG